MKQFGNLQPFSGDCSSQLFHHHNTGVDMDASVLLFSILVALLLLLVK
jgi:hypothetical protein